MEDRVQHVDRVLKLLEEKQLYAKTSKCFFGVKEVEYLGNILSHEGVNVDPNKIKDINEWKVQTTIRQLRGFLRLTGYYHKFIKNYGIIATPLTMLLKKYAFPWTLEETKEEMFQAPILATPDFTNFLSCLLALPMHLLHFKG